MKLVKLSALLLVAIAFTQCGKDAAPVSAPAMLPVDAPLIVRVNDAEKFTAFSDSIALPYVQAIDVAALNKYSNGPWTGALVASGADKFDWIWTFKDTLGQGGSMTENETIYSIDSLYGFKVGSTWTISKKSALLQDLLNQRANGFSLAKDAQFSSLWNSASKADVMNLFIQHKEIAPVGNQFFQQDWSWMTHVAAWSEIDLALRKNKLIGTSVSLCPDSAQVFLNTFTSSVRSENISKVKGVFDFGFSGRYKFIDFESQQYEFRLNNQAGVYNIEIANFDGFFNNTNLNSLYFINQQKPQTYSGGQYINASFVNGMWNFNSRFSILLGLRAEMIAIEIDYLTLQSSNEERIAFIKEKLLPSLSAKYILKENMNFKFAASKTYTLPQFKERVNMLYEEVTQVYRGNNYVYESTNWNADLKWEYFPNDDELISATVFGKLIQNPINSIFINSTSNDISYINTGKQAEVYGLELELKKNLLSFNADDDEFDHKISGGLNISLLQTVQDLDTQKVTDETDYSANFTFDSSKLTGASDFLLNADVSYVKEFDTDKSIQGTVAYSYFSDQLNTIGTLNKGNVIDKSYGTLDFVVKSTMKQFSFGLSAKNLLNPTISRIQEVYNTPGTQEVVLDAFKKGVNLSLSIGYKF